MQLVEWKCSFLLLNPPLSTELGGEWSSFMKVWMATGRVEELSCSVDDMNYPRVEWKGSSSLTHLQLQELGEEPSSCAG